MPLNATVATIIADHPEQEKLLAELLRAQGKGMADLPESLPGARDAILGMLEPVIERELSDPVIEDVVLDGFELLCKLELL